MTEKEYRARARENLAGNWWLSIGVAAVACLLGGLVTGGSFLPNVSREVSQTNSALRLSLPFVYLTTGPIFAIIMALANFLIGGTIQLGHARYLLNQHDHRKLEFSTLFSQFAYFGTGFCQQFLRGLYVALWSLLLVIPGIVASYRYAMTPFILAENPTMTASQGIRASKELMQGHKWELFVLDLTFLGWDLLCVLTANLGNLALNPYKCAAHAAFYRRISGQEYTYIP